MLRPLAEAATYADISEHMKLATVRSHLTNLYGKLGVRSLAEVETQKGTGLVAPVLSRAVSSTTPSGCHWAPLRERARKSSTLPNVMRLASW